MKAVREEAATALAAIGDAAIPSLVKALQHDGLARSSPCGGIAWARPNRHGRWNLCLSVLFNDHDSAVREDAVRALGEIGDPQAVEHLFTAMREPGLRTVAVEALGQIGDPRAVPVLIDVVTGTSSPEVTRTVAGCGDQWNEEAITQGAAARALGAIGDEQGHSLARRITGSNPDESRSGGILGQIRVEGHSIPAFHCSMSHRDENLLFHVRETLTSAGWRAGRRSRAG